MSTLNATDLFAVRRGSQTYKVSYQDVLAGVVLPSVLTYMGATNPTAAPPAPTGGLKAGMTYVLTPGGKLAAGWTGIAGINATDGQLTIWEGAKWELIGNAIPQATETVSGIVELATAAETTTGTDATRAVHPAGLKVELDKLKLWDRTGTTLSPAVATDTIQGQLVPTNGALGSRNAIINGMVNINQRGVTIAAAAVGAYGPDRWKKVDAGNMTQIIEDGNFVPGATYTLSGTGVTTQQLTAPATGNWTLPNIPIAATNIQLELGTVATPFERRPYGLELELCQRYYCKSERFGVAGVDGFPHISGVIWQDSGGRMFVSGPAFPVTMRAAPTVRVSGVTTGTVGNVHLQSSAINVVLGGVDIPVQALKISNQGFNLDFTAGPPSTLGRVVFHWEASIEL